MDCSQGAKGILGLRRSPQTRIMSMLLVLGLVFGWLWAGAGLAQAQSGGKSDGQTGAPAGAYEPPADQSGRMPLMEAAKASREGLARTSSESGTGQGMATIVFSLAVALWLFGYFLFTNYGINSRISSLEKAVRDSLGSSSERDELVPFSWNSVLRSLTDGFPFLPGLALPRPGLVLLGVNGGGELTGAVVSNIARTVMQDPELVVLCVTRSIGTDDLGRRILSIEAGKDWRQAKDIERQEMLQSHNRKLECYEKSLFCMTDLVISPRQLYNTCQEILKDGDIGMVLTDGLDVLASDTQPNERPNPEDYEELLEHLRLVAARCHVPVCIVVREGSEAWKRLAHLNVFVAVASLTCQDTSSGLVVKGDFSTFPGPLPSAQWLYSRQSGALEPMTAKEV